jgi:hypothetical protein
MTPNQQAAVEAMERNSGGLCAAARELGIDRSSLRDRLKSCGRYPWVSDPGIQQALASTGVSASAAKFGYRRVEDPDGGFNTVFWRIDEAEQADFMDRLRDAFEGMQPAEPVQAPEVVHGDLLTVYPLMDVHFGMLAWGKETGADDYDMPHATNDMRHAFAKIAALTPPSAEAVLIVGGDFFHADDNRAETPTSKHKLDVDSRQFRVLDAGVALIAEVVERLLGKHGRVTIRVLRGNHDEHAHMVLTFALAERYRAEPRIEVEKTPRDLFMRQWGRTLIAAHHGDRAKPERLTLYLSDVCPFWSATRHRYCLTGHIHHDSAKDVGPLRWESLRAFAPPDAYAAGMGFASRRALQALTFHNVDGLVLRAIDPIERGQE